MPQHQPKSSLFDDRSVRDGILDLLRKVMRDLSPERSASGGTTTREQATNGTRH